MMSDRRPTPSERRMEELCDIRRPLTEYEIDLVRHLRVTIRKAEAFRRRYRSDAAFREREQTRARNNWRERNA